MQGADPRGPGDPNPIVPLRASTCQVTEIWYKFIENVKAVYSGIASVMKLKLIASATSAETGH